MSLQKTLSIAIVLTLLVLVSPFLRAGEESTVFGRFGTVHLYFYSSNPSRVVLFVSGDGGWNLGVIDMARSLASLDSLVVGIDITYYLRQLARGEEKCSYPAGDFEELSKFVQKKLDFPSYIAPILVGYSSGATLVYAILVQAPSITFQGALSLGFCPDLSLPKPLCRGTGLEWQAGKKPNTYIFQPAQTLEVPWIALQGIEDLVCAPASTEGFVKRVKTGEIVFLPKVGHGFSVQKNWLPQFKQTFERLCGRKEEEEPLVDVKELQDLPLAEVPAQGSGGAILGVYITGDGGFGVTDKGVSHELAKHGIPVVALNSLRYFWNRRTPEAAAAALERIIRYYTAAWNKDEVVLIGYSLGADVLPFMANGLSEELKGKIRLMALLGPSRSVDFQFHLADWFGSPTHKNSLPVLPEIEKLGNVRIICFHGEDDKHSICGDIAGKLPNTEVISLPTGHRFGRNFTPIAEAILKDLF